VQAQHVGLQRSTVLGFVKTPARSSTETTLVRGETETVAAIERRFAAFAEVPQVSDLRIAHALSVTCSSHSMRFHGQCTCRQIAVQLASCDMALATISSSITTIARLHRGSGPPSCTCA